LEIRGPAVHQVVETFTERWNDPTPLDHRNPVRWALQRAARMPKRPMPLPSPLPAAPAAGPHSVQLLRTYAAKRPPYPFAPGGERTVARGLLHAFARARRYIYIEDQYLWSALVAAPLAAALRNTPDLHLIAVVPRYPDDDGRLTGPPNRLGQLAAIHALLDAAPERVGVFDLENAAGTPIYVHAKVCVVDDVWMSCGSSNLNRRSWTHDSEATCAVVGADLPGRLRTTLWAEHLGLPAEDPRLHDPAGGLAIWRERASALDEWHGGGRRGERPPGRVRCHRPDPVPRRQRWWVVPAYHLVHDPDGRPTSWRLGNRW
jgi:phosphatidylserine/phosphatidylglycerophosphate/cardiolipin synthase-like enzyme